MFYNSLWQNIFIDFTNQLQINANLDSHPTESKLDVTKDVLYSIKTNNQSRSRTYKVIYTEKTVRIYIYIYIIVQFSLPKSEVTGRQFNFALWESSFLRRVKIIL